MFFSVFQCACVENLNIAGCAQCSCLGGGRGCEAVRNGVEDGRGACEDGLVCLFVFLCAPRRVEKTKERKYPEGRATPYKKRVLSDESERRVLSGGVGDGSGAGGAGRAPGRR